MSTDEGFPCAFHPEQRTLRSCNRCDRPACNACLTEAFIGFHCQACVAGVSPTEPIDPSKFSSKPSATSLAKKTPSRWKKAPEPALGLPIGDDLSRLTRPHPIFLGLVALWVGVIAWGWISPGSVTSQRVQVFLIVFVGWLISLCLHEFAHAYVAYRSGDHSVIARGYLTLNPLKYTHPVLSIVIPLAFLAIGGIGLPGGAVWINRGAIPSKRNQSLVSLAGPFTNLVFGIALFVPFIVGAIKDDTVVLHLNVISGLAYLGFLQFIAVLLNMLPVPGLDGYGALEPHLPLGFRQAIAPFAQYSTLILFILLFQTRVVDSFVFGNAYTITDFLGAPYVAGASLVDYGQELARFWRR